MDQLWVQVAIGVAAGILLAGAIVAIFRALGDPYVLKLLLLLFGTTLFCGLVVLFLSLDSRIVFPEWLAWAQLLTGFALGSGAVEVLKGLWPAFRGEMAYMGSEAPADVLLNRDAWVQIICILLFVLVLITMFVSSGFWIRTAIYRMNGANGFDWLWSVS